MLVPFYKKALKYFSNETDYMLNSSIHVHYLGLLSISCGLTNQEHRERWGFGLLGDVDDLLQSGHAKGDVLGGHTGIMESVERHLGGWLSQRLGS